MNQLVDQFMKVINQTEVIPTKTEDQGLPEVKELPEEEDENTTRNTTVNKSRNHKTNDFSKNHCYFSASVMVNHTKCISTKLEPKYVPDDESADFTNQQPSIKFPKFKRAELNPVKNIRIPIEKMHSDNEPTEIVMECLKEKEDKPVEYIIEDIDLNVEFDRPHLDKNTRNKYSQSVIVPHRSDDPAVDSEESDSKRGSKSSAVFLGNFHKVK